MAWSQPVEEKYFIEKKPFAHGGFRFVFKAKDLAGKQLVIKKFLKKTYDAIDMVNKANSGKKEFGRTFSYRIAKLGKLLEDSGEYFFVMVEDFIKGEFSKYVNNDGNSTLEGIVDTELTQKAECLAHFTFLKSEKKILLLDTQCSGYQLYDPEIATSD
ncbi:myosin heavy chain kinase C-like [Hydractinia symbiolongicarpus]|uniref:myosin heavy chain kinase C-like n=1 Tax=Hydractinia symbiolongicarpus TaxID=13093 RepID=UPI00254A7C66|nr:myosin heavy chain kinase C-like [Hydractinia symbiolongicarpus]